MIPLGESKPESTYFKGGHDRESEDALPHTRIRSPNIGRVGLGGVRNIPPHYHPEVRAGEDRNAHRPKGALGKYTLDIRGRAKLPKSEHSRRLI